MTKKEIRRDPVHDMHPMAIKAGKSAVAALLSTSVVATVQLFSVAEPSRVQVVAAYIYAVGIPFMVLGWANMDEINLHKHNAPKVFGIILGLVLGVMGTALLFWQIHWGAAFLFVVAVWVALKIDQGESPAKFQDDDPAVSNSES